MTKRLAFCRVVLYVILRSLAATGQRRDLLEPSRGRNRPTQLCFCAFNSIGSSVLESLVKQAFAIVTGQLQMTHPSEFLGDFLLRFCGTLAATGRGPRYANGCNTACLPRMPRFLFVPSEEVHIEMARNVIQDHRRFLSIRGSCCISSLTLEAISWYSRTA